MERVIDILQAGCWPQASERDSVTLTYQDRHRRRLVMRGERGLSFLLERPQAVMLRDGDGLQLEGGGHVRVVAAAEALLEVTADAPAALARFAWHIGNRHLPAEIRPTCILIHRDPVIADMLAHLGARMREVTAPFNPEGGAYGTGGDQRHAHRAADRHAREHAGPGGAAGEDVDR